MSEVGVNARERIVLKPSIYSGVFLWGRCRTGGQAGSAEANLD
jgi:hypothetical protein